MSEAAEPHANTAGPPAFGLGRIFLAIAVVLLVASSPWLLLAGYLDFLGVAAGGVVTERHEAVVIRGDHWHRNLVVAFRYRMRDSSESAMASQPVTPAAFDSLKPGTPVRVLYSPWAPLRALGSAGATLADVPWHARLPRDSDMLRTVIEIEVFVGTAFLGWLAYRRRSWPLGLIALTAAVSIGAGVLLYGFLIFPLLLLLAWRRPRKGFGWVFLASMAGSAALLAARIPWPSTPPTGGAPVRTEAVVRQVHEVQSVWHTTRVRAGTTYVTLKQPFQIVDLEVTAAGTGESVHAVDSIDSGSAPGLSIGAHVPVIYPEGYPHAARVVGATRQYGWVLFKDVMGMTYALAAVVLVIGWPILRLLGKLQKFALPEPGQFKRALERLPEGDPRRRALEERIRRLQQHGDGSGTGPPGA